MYGQRSNVAQVVRSSNGEMIAVGRDPRSKSDAIFGAVSAIIEIAGRTSGKIYRLRGFPPAHICGFSPDDRYLLAIVPPQGRDRQIGQLCLVSLPNGMVQTHV